jgi:hypothetical protein
MMALKTRRLAPLALAALAATAQAQSDAPSMFSFSGFATLGLVGTNTNDAQYAINGQMRGADKTWSGEVDSKLGLQVNGRFSPMFSGTVQLLSKQNGDGNFKPGLEWAFLKAQVAQGTSIRLGRMGAPFFAVSDFRNVGYANTWLRPPLEVYGQVPFSQFDGADLTYQTTLGSATVNLQFYGGQAKDSYERTDIKFKKMAGFNSTAEFDGFTLRLGHVEGKVTVESATLSQLVAGLRSVPLAAVSSVGNQLSAADKNAAFTGFGVTFDQGNFVGSLEYTMRRCECYIADTTGWYATLGYRVGKFTPYGTVSQLKVDSSNVNNTIPMGVNTQLTTLKLTVDGLVASQNIAQKAVGVGLRWDLMRNVALKAQYDRVKPDASGLFTADQAGFGGKNVNVYSLAVDTVF